MKQGVQMNFLYLLYGHLTRTQSRENTWILLWHQLEVAWKFLFNSAVPPGRQVDIPVEGITRSREGTTEPQLL